MLGKTQPQRARKLPADVIDIAVIRQMLGVPPSIHESVAVLLVERGKLYAFKAGARPSLAGQSDYLEALSEFCDRVPGVAAYLKPAKGKAR